MLGVLVLWLVLCVLVIVVFVYHVSAAVDVLLWHVKWINCFSLFVIVCPELQHFLVGQTEKVCHVLLIISFFQVFN